MIIGASYQEIEILGLSIPFYVISLIFLGYIIYLKWSPLNEQVKKFFNWIFFKIKEIYIKTKNGTLLKKIKKFFHLENKEQLETHESKQLYVGLVFLISIFIFSSYLLLPDFYTRNVPELVKSTFLGIALLVFISVWFIMIFIYSEKTYIKDFFLWVTILASLYIIGIYNNTLSKILGTLTILIVIIIYPTLLKREKKPRIWIWITFLIMVASLFSGIALIDTVYGNHHPVEMSLNIDGNMSTKYAGGKGNVYCSLSDDKANSTIGENINCSLIPKLDLDSFNVTVSYKNGSTEQFDLLKNERSFYIKENIEYVYFDVYGKVKGKPIHLSTGGNPNFEDYPSIDERKQDKENFIKYLGILFTAVFISIPVMMYHLRALSKRKTDEKF